MHIWQEQPESRTQSSKCLPFMRLSAHDTVHLFPLLYWLDLYAYSCCLASSFPFFLQSKLNSFYNFSLHVLFLAQIASIAFVISQKIHIQILISFLGIVSSPFPSNQAWWCILLLIGLFVISLLKRVALTSSISSNSLPYNMVDTKWS